MGVRRKDSFSLKKNKLQILFVKQKAGEDWVTPECPLLQLMLMSALSLGLLSPRKLSAQCPLRPVALVTAGSCSAQAGRI